MWSAPSLIVPPATSAVTLDALKEFVRVDVGTPYFDGQLAAFAEVATHHIEAMCGIRLVPQTVELSADDWDSLARLPIGPVTAITSIHYRDQTGAEQLLSPALYELAGSGLARAIRPSFGAQWPVALAASGAIQVRLVAGYAALPGPLWAAVLYLAADLFAFRETAVTGAAAQAIPMSATVEAMLANYRIWL